MELISFLIDFILHVDQHLTQLLAQYGVWIYGILFAIIFCETGLVVTPFLPGDSLLFVAGTLAATPGDGMSVHVLVPLLILAAVCGDNTNYLVGRLAGEKLFANPDSKIFRRSYLERTHAFYERHGSKTVILARFAPIVRTFAPFVAGAGRMPWPRFFASSLAGSLLWVGLFCYAGYLFGNIPVIRKNLELMALGIIFVSFLPALIEILRHKRRQSA